jgi:glycerophosphoryl diester phosphodiesterase
MKTVFVLLLAALSAAAVEPAVIAHRGASGYLPEHTLEAVTLAHAQGAEHIEQDLVLSRDDVPVVLHDIHLDSVTDVAAKFPSRKREDGRWYALDFTLAELKQLRVTERFSPRRARRPSPAVSRCGRAIFRSPRWRRSLN